MRRFSRFFLTLFLFVSLTAGCSTQKTVTTRTVQYDPRTGEPVTVEKETTTTTESSATGASVLSGTMGVLGEILAVPVRIVGILIHAIL
jgi:type IV pilus biogenesis protein CpaD/CtpE